NTWYVSMNTLVPGDYTFVINDACGEHTVPVTVIGYEITLNELEVTENCGSFELYMEHQANNSTGLPSINYYLEQYNETTGEWLSPSGGVYYVQTSGQTLTIPINGISLIVNQNLISESAEEFFWSSEV